MKLKILLLSFLAVFLMVGSASAYWFSTNYLPDDPVQIGNSFEYEFDTYFEMNGDNWKDVLYFAWTDDPGDPYRHVVSAPFDYSMETFTLPGDPDSGFDVDLVISGLSNRPQHPSELESAAGVILTLTPNQSGAGELYFSGIQVIYDPVPEPATMFLLGSGLIGLAAFGRKKFFKKS